MTAISSRRPSEPQGRDGVVTRSVRRDVPLGRVARPLYGVLGVVVCLAAWQLAALSGRFGSGLPDVVSTARALLTQGSDGQFWIDVAATIGVSFVGLLVAAAAGIVFGVLAGRFSWLRAATLAVVEFLKPIPPIVVLPLAVMIWGPTSKMAIFLVVVGCTLAIAIQTIDGVKDTDPVALDTARSYGIGTGESLARIVLPSALPYIGTALRIATPTALVVTVVAGLLGGAPGLGRTLYQAQAAGDMPGVYALVVVLGIMGLGAIGVSHLVERRVLHWHVSFRRAAA